MNPPLAARRNLITFARWVMNVRSPFCIALFAWTCVLSLAAAKSKPPEVKLEAGTTPGTYHWIFKSRVTFSMEPQFPVAVSICNRKGEIARVDVRDERPFEIAVDVP